MLCLLAGMSALLLGFSSSIVLAYRLSAVRHTLRAGDARAAAAMLDQLADRGAQSAEWHYLLAGALRRSGRLAEAEKHLDRAKVLGWNSHDVRRAELLIKARNGQIKQVEAQLAELLAAGENDEAAEEIYEAMSQGYWSSYYVADALKCLEFWSAWQPNNLVPRLWMADLYKRSDKPNAAAAEYQKILELKPKHPEALVRLGELTLRRLEVNDAADLFARCLVQSPESPDALLGLANCRRRQGKMDQVKDLLNEVLTLELTPLQASQALAVLGTLALEERDYRRAIQLLQESIRLDSNDPATHSSLASALAAIGQEDLAVAARQRARDTSERHSRLMRTTSKAVEEPQNADLRCRAGLILMEQGFWSEGADWIKTAVQIDPQHRAAHEGLAKYYEHIGNSEQAKRHRALAEQAAHMTRSADSNDG